MRYYHYLSTDLTVIRIKARLRPSFETMPQSGCWIVQEAIAINDWRMATFPEIPWGVLKTLEFLGSTPEYK